MNLEGEKYGNVERLIIIALVIIISISILYLIINYNNASIKGFWEISKSYCEKSGLSDMMIFIGDKDKKNILGYQTRFGYVITSINGETNTTLVRIILKPQGFFRIFSKKRGYIHYTAEFTDEDGKSIELDFPSKLSLMYNQSLGKMVLYKQKKLYGVFYRNTEVLDDEVLDFDC
jgi:hypothetical protein